jgi:septum formation protein
MKPLLLASTSKYKKQVFERLALPFDTAAPPYEEVKPPGVAPRDVALHLSEGKAQSLVSAYPERVIVAGDQVLELEGELLSKPGNLDAAVAQVMRMSGKTHRLLTAYCVLDAATGEKRQGCDEARITFHGNLNLDFVRKLVEMDRSWDCVGAYKFEAHGPLLMESVSLGDPNAIVGLPLFELIAVLTDMGYYADRHQS